MGKENSSTFWSKTKVDGIVRWGKDLWEKDHLAEMTRAQRIVARNIRVFFLVARLEALRKIKLHAQALTYATVLSIVPLLVVLFSLFKGFGGTEGLVKQITAPIIANVSVSPQQAAELTAYVQDFVGNISIGELGMVSLLILIWSVLMLLNHIEDSFNAIFGVVSKRPFAMRILTYWAVLTFGPLLLGASIALTAGFQSSSFGQAVEELGQVWAFTLWAMPTLITWVAFTTMFLVVPATRVRFSAALLAAIVAGSAWNLLKFGFAWYAKNSVTQQNLYGSLAAVPLFVLWLYFSWLLVLFGAQLAFAFQNAETYRREDERLTASQNFLERAICRVFLEIARDFHSGNRPTTVDHLVAKLRVPRRILELVLNHLKDGGFIRRTNPDDGLVPAKELDRITVSSLTDHLRFGDSPDPVTLPDPPRVYFDKLFEQIDDERDKVAGNVNFRDLAEQFSSSASGQSLENGPAPGGLPENRLSS